jgi:hypothetical protein
MHYAVAATGHLADESIWLQDDVLVAYQITFDLVETEMQSFLIKVH